MNAQINEAAALWWQWMAPMLWQASLLVLIVTLVDWMISKWIWPQVRYAIWLLILLKLVIPPSWSSPVSLVSWAKPRVERSLLKVRTDATAPLDDVSGTAMEPGTAQPAGVSLPSPERSSAAAQSGAVPSSRRGVSAEAWAMIVWIGGMLVFSALLLLKMARLRRWHQLQKEREIPKWFHELLVGTAGRLGLRQIPAIVFAKDAVTPAVYGMFRPVLLIPAGYLNRLSRREAEHVLLHELSHLKRGDLWVHGLYLVLHVVYWFNPFLIWTRRQMKHVREICCDLSVAQVLREKTKAYRQTLLDSARSLLTETVEPGLGLLGVFEEPFRLVSRLKWLEKESWKNRKWIAAASLLAGIGMAAVMIPMSGAEPSVFEDDEIAFSSPPGAGPMRDAVQKADTGLPDLTISIKRTDAMTAVVLPKIGPPAPMLESAMAELKELLKKQRIKPSGDPFFRLWSDPEKVPHNQFIWEVGFAVKAGVSVQPPLECFRISSMHVASAAVNDVFDTEPVWDGFIRKIQGMGLTPAHPPAVEVYRTRDKGEPFWSKTELQMQVLRPGQPYPGMDIRIRETASAAALVLPVQGSYVQFDDAVNRVKKYIRKEKIRVSGRWFCMYLNDPSQIMPGEYLWQVGCELEPRDDLKVNPPFELQHHEKDTVASAFYNEPPETEFPFAPFIIQNLMNGYMISGPMGVAWQEDSLKKNQEAERTELFMPVERLEDFAGRMEAFGRAMGGIPEKTSMEAGLKEEQKKVEFKSQAMEISLKEKQEKAEFDRQAMETGLKEEQEKAETDRLVAAGEKEASGKPGWKEKVSEFFRQSSESEGTRHPWTLRRTDPYWAILLPATGSMDQQTVVFEKLRNYMKANGIVSVGLPFMHQYYSGEIVQGFELRWEAGYRIADSVFVKPPFLVVRVPGREVLAVHYTQSMNQKTMNVQLASWLYHNGYRTRMPQVITWSGGIPRTLAELKSADAELPVEKMDKPYLDVRLFTRSDTDRRELLMRVTGGWKQEDEAVLKLKKYIQENKIETLGDVFVEYHLSPEITPEKDLVWEVGVPIRENVRALGPFRTEWRHGRLLACTDYEGDRIDIPEEFWWSYSLNFVMSGYMAAGYPRKVLREQLPGNKWRVELQWPVRQ